MDLTAVLADQVTWDTVRDLTKSSGDSCPEPPRRIQQKQVRLTKDEQVKLVVAYVDGDTLKQLAEQFEVHPTTVTAILERHGVPRRYRKLAGETLVQAAQLYASGMSLADIGTRLDVDASTVHRALKKLD